MCELTLQVKDGSKITFLFDDYSEMSNFMFVALSAASEIVEAIVSFPMDKPDENIKITK